MKVTLNLYCFNGSHSLLCIASILHLFFIKSSIRIHFYSVFLTLLKSHYCPVDSCIGNMSFLHKCACSCTCIITLCVFIDCEGLCNLDRCEFSSCPCVLKAENKWVDWVMVEFCLVQRRVELGVRSLSFVIAGARHPSCRAALGTACVVED